MHLKNYYLYPVWIYQVIKNYHLKLKYKITIADVKSLQLKFYIFTGKYSLFWEKQNPSKQL